MRLVPSHVCSRAVAGLQQGFLSRGSQQPSRLSTVKMHKSTTPCPPRNPPPACPAPLPDAPATSGTPKDCFVGGLPGLARLGLALGPPLACFLAHSGAVLGTG